MYMNYLRYAVAQLVQALRYKPEGRGFDSDGAIGIFRLQNSSGRAMAVSWAKLVGIGERSLILSTRENLHGNSAAI
jgi:hypothetical protein